MQEKKKYFTTLLLSIVVVLVFVAGATMVFKKERIYNEKVDQANNNEIVDQNKSDGTTDNSVSNFEIKRIIYSLDENIYSSDLNGGDVKNLTNLLDLQQHEKIHSNKDVSRVAYVTKTSVNLSIWLANSDGSNPKKVFNTNNSGCNFIEIYGINAAGNAVIFNYVPHYEGEIGTCVPHSTPQKDNEGVFYMKLGDSVEKYLSSTHFSILQNSVMGFSENKILWVSKNKGAIVSVWLMNPDTSVITKLFDMPESLRWSTYSNLFISEETSMAIFQVGGGPENISSIVAYDYKNNAIHEIVSGDFAEYQGVRASPNLKHFIYERDIPIGGGYITREFFLYDVINKKSTQIDLGQGHSLVLWKNDSSFYYRSPLVGSWPPKEEGGVKLFDVKSLTSKTVFGTVSEIMGSDFRSL